MAAILNSYTGEDLVEFSCHGNPLIVQSILKAICTLGARPAKAWRIYGAGLPEWKNGFNEKRKPFSMSYTHVPDRALLAGQRALAGQLSDRLMADRETLLQLARSN